MSKFTQCIGGKLSDGLGSPVDIINPANELTIATVKESSLEQLDIAVVSANKAFDKWKTTSNVVRNDYLKKIISVIELNKEKIASLITIEQGKPLPLARLEVDASISWIQYSLSLNIEPKVIEKSSERTITAYYEPLGVVASITPWNWPVMIAIWHVIPAIKAGNTVIIKPSNFTPLSTLLLVELMNQVLPPGVVNSVVGDTEVGVALSSHQGISKIVFTGSTPTGQAIMRNSAANLKSLTLELGGNDPAFILNDVDIDEAAAKVFQTAFLNMGQTCAAIKRLYVHDEIFDEFCKKLVEHAHNSIVGDGSHEGVTFGPIQNQQQLNIVESLIADAVAHGANILYGGERLDRPGFFFPPTLVTNISPGVRLVDEEQFGPVLPIIKFSEIRSAITQANNNTNGLGSSIWTSNAELASELCSIVEAGTTWINNHAEVLPYAPFGGCKMSGIGVEFGEEGFKAYMRMHIINHSK